LNCSNGYCAGSSPILIDLESNDPDYDLTTPVDGAPFDLNTDGILEQLSWTGPGSRVAFLALDRNDNGIIDDGSELFGNFTRLRSGQRAANGFEALLDLDGGASRSDGQITADDPIYDRLRLWIDRTHDGYSQRDELMTLRGAGVISISTEYRESKRVDKNGNQYAYVGRALIRQRGRNVPRRVFDVFLTEMSIK
jgi:hypothetical protein